MVRSAPTTNSITSVLIFHILCVSISRSLYLLFFSISLLDTFLSQGAVISISLQVEFTLSLIMILGLFALIRLSACTATSQSTVCVSVLVTVSGWCSYQLSDVLTPKYYYCYYARIRSDSDQIISDRIGFLKWANYWSVSTQSDPMHTSRMYGLWDFELRSSKRRQIVCSFVSLYLRTLGSGFNKLLGSPALFEITAFRIVNHTNEKKVILPTKFEVRYSVHFQSDKDCLF